VFLAGIGVAFIFEAAEGGDDLGAGVGRLDDRVDVAAFRGDVGIGKGVAKFVDLVAAQGLAFRCGGAIDFAFVDDVDGAFGAHNRDFRGGPREIVIGANVFRGHDAVRAAVGLSGDQRNLRNGRFGVRIQKLRAVADDAAKFLLGPGKKAGNIFQGEQRDIETIARLLSMH